MCGRRRGNGKSFSIETHEKRESQFMMIQPEIDFATSGPPAVSGEDLGVVLELLRRHTGWFTAHDLLVELGNAPSENRKRWLRRIAEESDGQIISGQQGYKLTRLATGEEIAHAAHWLEHQAVRLGDRARAIRRRAPRGEWVSRSVSE
jgi:hypothetical protein